MTKQKIEETASEFTGLPQTLIDRSWLDASSGKPVKIESFWTGLEDLSDGPPQYTQEDIAAAEAELARAKSQRENPPAPRGAREPRPVKGSRGSQEFSVWVGNSRVIITPDIFSAEVEFKKVKKQAGARVMKGDKQLGPASFSSMCSVARKATK